MQKGKAVAAGIRVALADSSDLEDIKHLYDAVVEDNSGTKHDVLWRRDLHPSDAALEAAVAAGELYGAWLDDELVGAAVVNCDFAPGYDTVPWHVEAEIGQARCLHLFCTHPMYQGKGLGSAFLHELFEQLRCQDVRALRLDVFDYNAPARHLYEKLGFELVGITHLAYEDQQVHHIPFAMYEKAL